MDEVFYLFCQQRKTLPRDEEDGRMIPAAKDSEMYFSIASCFGLERLYNLLEGSGAPGSRSMAQS